MRKLYLFLTAALLLICSSAHALLIATVGDKAFDSDTYSKYDDPNAVAFYFALMESGRQNLPAVIQNDFTLKTSYTTPKSTINLNGHSISSTTRIFQIKEVSVDIIGEGTLNSSVNGVAIELYGSAENIANYNSLYIGENVTLNAPNGWGICIYGDDNSMNNAYGVVVNIDGRINASSGITISGNVNKTEGNVPIININDGAKIYGQVGGDGDPEPDGQDGNSIYAAGYGIWNVGKATLTANNPIHAKAGIINLSGTTITATRDFYTPFRYDANGGKPTGNAIAIESNHAYAGNVFLNISNGTTITSKAGYAIEEAIVCNGNVCKDETQQIGLTVTDGQGDDKINAFSGALGTMKFSESFAQALKDGSIEGKEAGQYIWVVNAITGGKYSEIPEVIADGYEIVVTSDAQFPYTVKKASDIDFNEGDIETITADAEVSDKLVGAGKQLIIKSGVTYKVNGTLTIGDDEHSKSQVVVEPGATLIAGTGGIVLNNSIGVKSLILKADKDNGTGVLLFDGTTNNANPMATVEMYLKGKSNQDGTYIWQHFGLPMNANAIAAIEKDMVVTYNDWNIQKGWVPSASGASVVEQGPWVGHNTTTNAVVEGGIFKFEGNIVGNVNKELELVYGYNCLANSYTAKMGIEEFIKALSGVNSDKMVWVYDPVRNEFDKFNEGSFIFADDPGIAPMQAFFIGKRDMAQTNITLNYNDVVYGSASTKGAEATEYNGGLIKLSADGLGTASLQILEGESFSDEFEDGYDGDQMETGMIQIYIQQGTHKLAAIATNKLEGKEITIVTKGATEYTLSFDKLVGNAFKLIDLASGAEIEVGADKTYTFTAAANSTIQRFKLGEGEVSANEADANNVNVWVANNSLNIAGATEGDAVEIINLAGVKVLSATATGEAVQTISLGGIASGAYIVKAGAATVKVIK